MPQLVAFKGYGTSECPAPGPLVNGERLVSSFGYGSFLVVPAPTGDFGGGGTGSFALYKPRAEEIALPTGLRLPEWTFNPDLNAAVPKATAFRDQADTVGTVPTKPTGPTITPPVEAPPPAVRDQRRDVEGAPVTHTGPAPLDPAPPPLVRDQHDTVEAPRTKPTGPTPLDPAPAPLVRDQLGTVDSPPLKPTAQPVQTPAEPPDATIVADQSRWLDFSKLAQLPTGPAINEYKPPLPVIVPQGRDVVVPSTKQPGLQTSTEPAPPPLVRDQHDPSVLEGIPQKRPGVEYAPAPAPPRGERENTAWMRHGVTDTTALPRGANVDAPPAVLAPLGGDDLFQTRRIAPPPAGDPARRAVSPYLADDAGNLRQHVYAWAQSVLRWQAGRHRLGDRSPVPSPGQLTIPKEYVWHIATRERLDERAAQRRAKMEVVAELRRIIGGTDAPPAPWLDALRDAQRGPGLLQRLWQRLRG